MSGSSSTCVTVYAPFHETHGPQLALGMLTAAARSYRNGELLTRFDIRRPESSRQMLARLAHTPGSCVILCSDYVWSLEQNLELVRQAKLIRPDAVAVHGGPSCPKYERAADDFLRSNTLEADILVRGEGELALCELLEGLADHDMSITVDALGSIGSLTFIDQRTGEVCRTEDRGRIPDLSLLPSPYLTGEFDDIDPAAWCNVVPIETNRGCPYGCSFCDWGSATMSRIRWFDLNRVADEIAWIAERGHPALYLADANFGISARDVEVAKSCAETFADTGLPMHVVFAPAKNTTRHLVEIMDVLQGAGIAVHAALALQTTDAGTLEAVNRKNISTDRYLELARDLRCRGYPVVGELMFGLPGQTPGSFKDDLQFMLDHEIQQRSWPTNAIPNSPMQSPDYADEWAIITDEDGLVRATSTFNSAGLVEMRELRHLEVICERFGVLRHPLRFIQWEHGVNALDVMNELRELAFADQPTEFPALAFLLRRFDVFPTPPIGWVHVYEEFRRFVTNNLGVADSAALRTVLAVQAHLMPYPGRRFPARLPLEHNYVDYYLEATRSLWTDGRPGVPAKRLEEYDHGMLVVAGDPLGLCENGPYVDIGSELKPSDSNATTPEGDFYSGDHSAYELLSPLMRHLVPVAAAGVRPVRDANGDLRAPHRQAAVTARPRGSETVAGHAQESRHLEYVSAMLPDLLHGKELESLHLGHWPDEELDDPHRDLKRSQRVTTEVLLEMAQVRPGDRVLDVGCGTGAVASVLPSDVLVTGIDIDLRLLRWASIEARWRGVNPLDSCGDACAVPLRSESVDVAISIEAAQHFSSRLEFLRELFRVVRPGGRLVMSDLTIDVERSTRDLEVESLLDQLADGFGPWPELRTSSASVVSQASLAGWTCEQFVDATENTLPTHSCHATQDQRPHTRAIGSAAAGKAFVELHRTGVLRPVYLGFRK